MLLEQRQTGAGWTVVGLGPIFGTASKSVPMRPLGLDMIRQVGAVTTIPVIAIAGITVANIADVIAAVASIDPVMGGVDR